MTRVPMAAWITTSNSCRGMSSLSFLATLRPQPYASSLWMMTLKASTGLPLISMSSLTSWFGR